MLTALDVSRHHQGRLCPCGLTTVVAFDGLENLDTGAQEVAFTCDRCLTPHWITLRRLPDLDA